VGLGVLLLGALVAPAALVLERHEWAPLAGDLPAWVALLLAVAVPLVATYASLRGALDRGRGHARAAVLGAATVLAFAVPAYAWGAMRLDAWRALDPDEPDFRVASVAVGHDGRYAFLSVARHAGYVNPFHHPTMRPWRVDLETGAWTEIGGLGDCVIEDSSLLIYYGSVRPTTGLVSVRSARGESSVAWWDALRGEPWRTLPWRLRPPELVDRLRDDLRRTTPVRRPDGSRAWALDPRAGVRDVPVERIEWDLPAGGVGFA
jgi:hypothetical protein